MEELLNKLIEKGRVPFGLEGVKAVKYAEQYYRNYNWVFWGGGWQQWRSLRQTVSKESGLRQFCVENKLVKLIENPNENKLPRDRMSEEEFRIWEYNVYYSFSNKKDIHKRYEQNSLTYLLIESALCDEDKLEQFLLDNIKIS